LPIPFNLTESQTETQTGGRGSPGGSFWLSSFIHASDHHDYMVVSHVIAANSFKLSNLTLYRASILDITNPSRYAQFSFTSDVSNVFSDNGDFNAAFANYGFASAQPVEATPAMRTWSNVSGIEFDLNFQLSSPALLNGGLGYFPAANSNVYEWGAPAAKTTGWLSLNGSKVTVDTTKSLTWYDRQWTGAPSPWTWFELHIDDGRHGGSAIPMSIWTWKDGTSSLAGLATIREAPGIQTVVPVTSLQPSNRTYTSKATNSVYPLDWVLKLADGTRLSVSSVRPDQELFAQGGIYPTYEGYVTVTGTYKGSRKVTGYGLVEVVPTQHV
jgi:hypothetical protein